MCRALSNPSQGEIVIYQPDEVTRLEVKVEGETVWLTQDQIAILFGVKRPAITKHIRNIFLSEELEESSVCSILERTAADDKIYMTRFYNLDMILSVGYRVNSKNAIHFRRWASVVLKEYMLKGFAINQRLHQIEDRFLYPYIIASFKDLGKKLFAFSKMNISKDILL